MSYWNLPSSVVRFAAEHFAKGLLPLSTGNGIASFSSWLKRQIIVFLSMAQRSRCGNSSREVTSYKPPLSDDNGSAATGPIDCVTIAEAAIAAHADNQAANVVAPSRVLRRMNVKRAFMSPPVHISAALDLTGRIRGRGDEQLDRSRRKNSKRWRRHRP